MKYYIPEILQNAKEQFGEDNYIFEKCDGKYMPHTFADFYDDVTAVAGSLQQTHMPKDVIVICGANSYEYMVADLAVMGFVCASATLSKEWNEYDLGKALEILHPKTFLYSETKVDVVDKLRNKYLEVNFVSLAKLPRADAAELDWNRIETTAASKIIFTSGTTSMPKAVMLSQENMFACYDDLARRVPLNHGDRDYLFLPLGHTYANIWNFLISLISGMEIYLCGDTKQIIAELSEVKPTLFCAVPFIFEQIYQLCQTTDKTPREILGGRIKHLITGGAYLKPEIRQLFKDDGIDILGTYGLTETSSLVCIEYPGSNDFATDGTIIEAMSAKIDQPDEDGVGELLVKGPNVFIGYYGNPEATKKAMTNDGYFRTGDLVQMRKYLPGETGGEICFETDDANTEYHLYVKGRKKRVIVFSNGENIYPADIEAMFDDVNISKVKVFEKDGAVFAQIFVREACDGRVYVDAVNVKLPKYSQIHGYETIVDSLDVRWKQ